MLLLPLLLCGQTLTSLFLHTSTSTHGHDGHDLGKLLCISVFIYPTTYTEVAKSRWKKETEKSKKTVEDRDDYSSGVKRSQRHKEK